MVFYDKKNEAPPAQIPIAIDGNCLKKFFSQWVIGIIINEELSFSPHLESITKTANKDVTG